MTAGRGGGSRRARAVRRVPGLTLLLGMLVSLALGPPLSGVEDPEAAVDPHQPPFATVPGGRLHLLFEKSVFQVNVLALEVQVTPEAAGRLQAVRGDAGLDAASRADSLVQAVLGASQAWVRMEFLRSVSQERFFDGIRKNLAKARRAGIITAAHEGRVAGQLPSWYDFLAERGVRRGDVLAYWIHGDSLETTYYGAGGESLFDYAQGDSEARFGVLGSYLAPGSDFRRGLLESLGEGP